MVESSPSGPVTTTDVNNKLFMGEVDTGPKGLPDHFKGHVFEVDKAIPTNDFGIAPFSKLPENVVP